MTKTNEKSQQAFTCSKLTIETLEQGVKYVQNEQWRYQKFPSLKTELRITRHETYLSQIASL